MAYRKTLNIQDYTPIMYPEDYSKIEWMNGLQVPYRTKMDNVKDLFKNPFSKSAREWVNKFKEETDYYTFRNFLDDTTSRYREAYSEVENQGEGINITSESLPNMYQLLVEACYTLGIKTIPNYTTDWYYGVHQYSNGEKNYRIVMISGSADLLTEPEMLFCLGHELGHHECGHKPYHMLVECMYMPFINEGLMAAMAAIIKLPLLEWYRTSDYTADRVGLLCCQDINAALSFMIKKAGLPKKCYDSIDIPSFIDQARHFDTNFTSIPDKVIKAISIRATEFPWLVARASKLLEWYESGDYQRILDNN